MAMEDAHFIHGHDALTTIYAARLREQNKKRQFFARFTHATKKMTMEEAAWGRYPGGKANSICTTIPNPFAYKGGDVRGGGDLHSVAMVEELVGGFKYGDETVQGSGGIDTLKYMGIYVNRIRREHMTKMGSMAAIRGGAWSKQLPKMSGPALMRLFSRWEAWYGWAYANLFGYSKHILAAAAAGGYAVTERHHPNLCVPGSPDNTSNGAVAARWTTWSATAATYEGYLAKNIGEASNGGANHHMSMDMLLKLRLIAEEKRLEPISFPDFGDRIVCVLTMRQWMQLLKDSEFRTALQHWSSAATDQSKVLFGSDSALFSDLIITHSWEGPCDIFVHNGEDNLTTDTVRAVLSKVEYGPLDTAAAEKDLTDVTVRKMDTGTSVHLGNQLGMLFGKGALVAIEAQPPMFLREDWDYKNKMGKDIDWVGGHGRADFYDNYGTPTAVENTSSIPFVTDSPTI